MSSCRAQLTEVWVWPSQPPGAFNMGQAHRLPTAPTRSRQDVKLWSRATGPHGFVGQMEGENQNQMLQRILAVVSFALPHEEQPSRACGA